MPCLPLCLIAAGRWTRNTFLLKSVHVIWTETHTYPTLLCYVVLSLARLRRKNRRGDSDSEDDEGGSSDEEDTKVDPKDDLRELANFERASRLQKVGTLLWCASY